MKNKEHPGTEGPCTDTHTADGAEPQAKQFFDASPFDNIDSPCMSFYKRLGEQTPPSQSSKRSATTAAAAGGENSPSSLVASPRELDELGEFLESPAAASAASASSSSESGSDDVRELCRMLHTVPHKQKNQAQPCEAFENNLVEVESFQELSRQLPVHDSNHHGMKPSEADQDERKFAALRQLLSLQPNHALPVPRRASQSSSVYPFAASSFSSKTTSDVRSAVLPSSCGNDNATPSHTMESVSLNHLLGSVVSAPTIRTRHGTADYRQGVIQGIIRSKKGEHPHHYVIGLEGQKRNLRLPAALLQTPSLGSNLVAASLRQSSSLGQAVKVLECESCGSAFSNVASFWGHHRHCADRPEAEAATNSASLPSSLHEQAVDALMNLQASPPAAVSIPGSETTGSRTKPSGTATRNTKKFRKCNRHPLCPKPHKHCGRCKTKPMEPTTLTPAFLRSTPDVVSQSQPENLCQDQVWVFQRLCVALSHSLADPGM